MSRPETYQEWRSLFHQLGRELGFTVYYGTADRRPGLTRRIWELRDQMRRVQLRLDVEADAGTASFCQAVLEALDLDF
jgi:hypothetical protein